MKINRTRILFFTAGPVPTDKEYEAALDLRGMNIGFRNVQLYSANTAMELCDAVAGEVPEAYAKKYPVVKTAEDVIELARKVTAVELQQHDPNRNMDEKPDHSTEAGAKADDGKKSDDDGKGEIPAAENSGKDSGGKSDTKKTDGDKSKNSSGTANKGGGSGWSPNAT